MDWFNPSDFDFGRDGAAFYATYQLPLMMIVASYYPMVFGLRHYMRDRKALDLGGGRTKCRVNWIFWWEASLAIFSIAGAWHVMPSVLVALSGHSSPTEAICSMKYGAQLGKGAGAYWGFLFNLSKFFEFGDTMFIVLRKKKLVVLQHYHHLATCLFCWWCSIVVYKYNSSICLIFSGMNLCVHSVMYTWYAACRTGWRSPKFLMIAVTLLQLSQMVVGSVVTYLAVSDHPACEWSAGDPVGSKAAQIMYASYFFLFAQLFYENYLVNNKKKTKQV